MVIDEHSKTEMLARNNKFECEACGSHQEAQKRIKVSAAPPCLILHLKRFKYIEQLQRCVTAATVQSITVRCGTSGRILYCAPHVDRLCRTLESIAWARA